MSPHLYIAFIAATTVLMLIPGPNVAFIVGNSVGRGTRSGLLTVAGTSTAMVLQLALTVAGLNTALGTLGAWFEWIRWIGVVYLIYLGLRQWFEKPINLAKTEREETAISKRSIFARGFLVSLTNPKTLFFYGAFFPQFITPAAREDGQVIVLVITFLLIAVMIDSTWAILAGRARHLLVTNGRIRNRISGSLLIGAGVGLALARRK
jgi:threonine/homoserine/homoserine lactone efflux protein